MPCIVGLGEIMLRLTPPLYERFMQTPQFNATFGGGEANVCVSCARFGLDSRYITALPKNAVGEKADELLRGQKVDTSCIHWGEGRIGVYFIERGSNQRGSSVLYDRDNALISLITPDLINWDQAYRGADWLHISGITPALSQKAAELTKAAVVEAKKRGVLVSCDLNYRKKLWKYGKKSSEVMPEIISMVDYLIANEEDIQLSLGISHHADVSKGELSAQDYLPLMHETTKAYPNLKFVATTLRESHSANHNGWSAILYDGQKLHVSRKYSITDIVDRVGGGDSFSAGLISGFYLFNKNLADALEFAVAASCLKHTIDGDWNLVSKDEVLALMKGDGSGRVQR